MLKTENLFHHIARGKPEMGKEIWGRLSVKEEIIRKRRNLEKGKRKKGI